MVWLEYAAFQVGRPWARHRLARTGSQSYKNSSESSPLIPERHGLSMTVMRTTKKWMDEKMVTNFAFLLVGIDINIK
jgi:hypothetical protein